MSVLGQTFRQLLQAQKKIKIPKTEKDVGAPPTASQAADDTMQQQAMAEDLAASQGMPPAQPDDVKWRPPGESTAPSQDVVGPPIVKAPEVTGAATPPASSVSALSESLFSRPPTAPAIESPRNFVRNYNFDQMDTTESVLGVIDQVAAINRPTGRKVQSVAETFELAKGYTFESLVGRQVPMGYSAEQATAATQIMLELGDRIDKLARFMTDHPEKVATEHQWQMKTMSSQLLAIEQVLSEAANEAGRTLHIMRTVKSARGYADAVRAQSDMLTNTWGPEGAQKLAETIRAVDSAPVPPDAILKVTKELGITPEEAVRLLKARAKLSAAKSAALPNGRDMWVAAYRNSLYTVKTHFRNISGTGVITTIMEPLEDVAASVFGSARRAILGSKTSSEQTYAGEAAMRYASLAGNLYSAAISLRHASSLADVGEAINRRRVTGQSLKAEQPMQAFTAANVRALADPHRGDVTRAGKMFGEMAGRLPTKALDGIGAVIHANENFMGVVDDLFLATNFEANMFARAYRQARHEGKTGTDVVDRMEEIFQAPPEAMVKSAMEDARRAQFTEHQYDDLIGDIANALKGARAKYPKAMSLVIPFINTPANLMRYTLTRSPFGPLMKRNQDRLMQGGVEADRAMAEMFIGNSVMAGGALLWYSGNITGTSNTTQEVRDMARRNNLPRGSIIIGEGDDRIAVSYQSAIDPVGMMLGVMPTLMDVMAQAPDENSMFEFVMGTAFATGAMLVDQSMMMGVARILDATMGNNEAALIDQLVRMGVDFTIYPLAGSAGGTIRQYVTQWGHGKPLVPWYQYERMSDAEKAKYAPIENPGLVEAHTRTRAIYATPITHHMDVVRQAILEAQRTWPGLNSDIAYLVDHWGNPALNHMNAIETFASPINIDRFHQLSDRDKLMVELGITLRPPRPRFRYTYPDGTQVRVNLAHFDYDGKSALTNPGWAITRYQEAIGRARREAADRFVKINPALRGEDSLLAAKVKEAITQAEARAQRDFMNQQVIRDQLAVPEQLTRAQMLRGEKKPVVPPSRQPEFVE